MNHTNDGENSTPRSLMVATIVTAAVLLMVCVAAVYGFGIMASPCATEDSTNCFWDAGVRGDGHGQSFVDVFGILIPIG